jgi:hypothetical protein
MHQNLQPGLALAWIDGQSVPCGFHSSPPVLVCVVILTIAGDCRYCS